MHIIISWVIINNYNPSILRTVMLAIFTEPTNTIRFSINCIKYDHNILLASAVVSTTDGEDANAENIMQESTIIAPSKHTPAYDFRNATPV